jgi:hypothetical protein
MLSLLPWVDWIAGGWVGAVQSVSQGEPFLGDALILAAANCRIPAATRPTSSRWLEHSAFSTPILDPEVKGEARLCPIGAPMTAGTARAQ